MGKIKLQKSKVDAMREYLKYKDGFASRIQSIRDTKATLTTDNEHIKEGFKELVNLRRELMICDGFTEEDFKNTHDFVRSLDGEEYEKIVGFEVVE